MASKVNSRQRPTAALLSAAAILVLAGCAAAGGSEPATEAPIEWPTHTPTAAPEPAVSLSDSWTNGRGYSYAIELDGVRLQTSKIDVADAPPGFADLDISWAAEGTWSNKTEGRNGSLTEQVVLVALWPIDSPVCVGRPALGGYCTLGDGRFLPESGDFAVDATVPVSLTLDLSPRVDEAQAQALLELYTHPAGWGFARQTQPSDVGNFSGCGVGSNWATRAVLTSATVDTGCGA